MKIILKNAPASIVIKNFLHLRMEIGSIVIMNAMSKIGFIRESKKSSIYKCAYKGMFFLSNYTWLLIMIVMKHFKNN